MAEDAKSLLERARSLNHGPGPLCKIHRLLAEDPRHAEITELLAAVKAGEIPYSVAEAALRDAGIECKADTISRHTRGRCSCHS